MERLTTRCNGQALMAWEHEEKHTTQEWIDILTDRLADYEDIGLSPEEIKDTIEIFRSYRHICAGLEPEQAKELAQAKNDGRMVVLPCKVGDYVYDISDGTAYETKVLSFSYHGDHWACRTVSSYPDLTEFGTRIFLTREEAEAALKR